MPGSNSKSGSCTCSIAPAERCPNGTRPSNGRSPSQSTSMGCAAAPHEHRFRFDDAIDDSTDGAHREISAIDGAVVVSLVQLPGPYGALRLRIDLENRTTATPRDRDTALRHALVAAHTLVTVDQGRFVSMTEGPEWATPDVKGCTNEGTWPVLAGSEQVVLSSPIILGDNPQIAPESPGDLYDATEIDEILTLRTMTLTDAEKAEARATDPRAARVIEQVDQLPAGASRSVARRAALPTSGRGRQRARCRRRPRPPHASANAVVGSWRRRLGRPGDRSRRCRGRADRTRVTRSATAGTQSPHRRSGSVPRRAQRDRRGSAVRRRWSAAPRCDARRRS